MAVDLIPGVGAGTLLETELLADDRAQRIGAIQRLDYHEAVVLTHDTWKFNAGGLPQFAFLLATARDISAEGGDDDEVLLLRIEGTAPLSLEADLYAVREEALRDALSRDDNPSPSVVLDVDMDPFTRNRASFTGLRCRILGTFYEEDLDGTRRLEFGADVDNFYATSTYRVLKPIGEGLSTIASYLKPSPHPVHRVRIGAVRYSATRRRAMAANQASAAVSVNIHDFIGHKTGLLGMTRTGKSNTAKIIVARTFAVSEERKALGGQPIGQLIFDPQGEYANDNTQDGSAIAAIGDRHVRIYRFGAGPGQGHVRPLGINFFDPAQIEAVQSMIADQLRISDNAGYVRDFAGTSFADVERDWDQIKRAQRGRLLLYASLLRADFAAPNHNPGTQFPYSVLIQINARLRQSLTPANGPAPFQVVRQDRGLCSVTADQIQPIVDAILALRDGGDQEAIRFCDNPIWIATEPIYTASSGGRQVRGWRNLNDLRPFHNPNTDADVSDEIYQNLLDGLIVIVDLHIGTSTVVQALSEAITRRILKHQTTAFTSGAEPPAIQVMLEEAHNLFSSKKYSDDGDVWVKLAKEAAKLRIGMLYATQEVSGVAHQVKANTANWVVAHLNNRTELNELSKFYDFGSFADAILSSEDRGYVRIKTLSSPFIVPTQIEKYDSALVNEARAAAGDPPLALGPIEP